MVADRTGVDGGGGPKVPTTPSPVAKNKTSPYVTKRMVTLSTGIITPEMEKYQAMLAKNPTSRVFAALAECYRKQGMLDEAIRLCVDGVKRYPNYMSGRVALGRAYFDKGMIKETRGELEKVVSITPNNIIANKVLGDVHLLEEDIEGAKEYFLKVVSMSPDDEDTAAKLSDIKAKKNPFASMIKEMKGEEEEVKEEKEDEKEEGEGDVKAKAMEAGESEGVVEGEGVELGSDTDKSLDDFLDDIDGEVIEDIEEIEPEPEENEQNGYVGDQLDLELEEGGEDIQLEGEGEEDVDIVSDIEPIKLTEEDEISLNEDYSATSLEDDLDISMEDIEVADLSEEEGKQEGGEVNVEDEFGILDDIFDSGDGIEDLARAVEEYSEKGVIPDEIEIESTPLEDVESGESEIAEIEGETSTEDKIIEDIKTDMVEMEQEDVGEYEGELEGGIAGKDVDISTETIADIYVKQGYYERALPIFEELSVAFPTRRTLREKVNHVKKKINEQKGVVVEGGEMGISSIDEGGLEIDAAVSENLLNQNIQNLQKWLKNVRKFKRIS